jgi:hypothetical protein
MLGFDCSDLAKPQDSWESRPQDAGSFQIRSGEVPTNRTATFGMGGGDMSMCAWLSVCYLERAQTFVFQN